MMDIWAYHSALLTAMGLLLVILIYRRQIKWRKAITDLLLPLLLLMRDGWRRTEQRIPSPSSYIAIHQHVD